MSSRHRHLLLKPAADSTSTSPISCLHRFSISWLAVFAFISVWFTHEESSLWSLPWPSGVNADENQHQNEYVNYHSCKAEANFGIVNLRGAKCQISLEQELHCLLHQVCCPLRIGDIYGFCSDPKLSSKNNKRLSDFTSRQVFVRSGKISDVSIQNGLDNDVLQTCGIEDSCVENGKELETTNDDRWVYYNSGDDSNDHYPENDNKQDTTDQLIENTSDDDTSFHDMHSEHNESFSNNTSVSASNNTSESASNSTSESASNDTSESAPMPNNTHNETHAVLKNLSKVHLREEPGAGLYNYASESKGAKILGNNKEAKGASNILNKDKDKYFRTPCNAEDKYVDIELSEETLVVEIVLANHEFYSSNTREFELWGSLTYPTNEWNLLGTFEAGNSRASQTFILAEPQWVRYLKIRIRSYYGSDFYCTMSTVEVHGVDAIEWLLEDWMGTGTVSPVVFEETTVKVDSATQTTDDAMDLDKPMSSTPVFSADDASTGKSSDHNEAKIKSPDKLPLYQPTSRPALDSVMKLLMEKVRSLEQDQPLLSQKLEESDERHKELLTLYSKQITVMKKKLDETSTEMTELTSWLHKMEEKWNHEKIDLESNVLDELRNWNFQLDLLRNEMAKSENKELVAITIALSSIVMVVVIQILNVCTSLFRSRNQNLSHLWAYSQSLWVIPFLCCSIIVFILLL